MRGLEPRICGHVLDHAVFYREYFERGRRAGIAGKGIEEGVVARGKLVAAVAVEIGRKQRSAIELPDIDRRPGRAVGTACDNAGIGAAMRAAGVERHHDLGPRIAWVELGDLHTDWRIGEAGAVSFKLRNHSAVGGDGDDRDARHVTFLALLLDIAQRRLHAALRDLLRGGFRIVGASAGLDLRGGVLRREVGDAQVFRVELLDCFGKARLRVGEVWRKQEACEEQKRRTQQALCGHAGAFLGSQSMLAREERACLV